MSETVKRPRITRRVRRSLFPGRSPDMFIAFADVGPYRIEGISEKRNPKETDRVWSVMLGDQMTPQEVLLTFEEALSYVRERT